MPRRNLAWLLGVAAVTLFGLAVSHSAPTGHKDKDYELVGLLVDVLAQVEQRYARPLDDEAKRKLVEDMINGGLERLDPHSGYLNPREYKQFRRQSHGNFGGVGIQVGADPRSGQLVVISPMVGTPAYEAGVQAGDLIVKIDGKPTENLRMNEAVELIQGEPGQKVVLTVIHEGSTDQVDLEMTRAKIQVQTVMGDVRKPDNPREWDWFLDKENQIAYVRLVAQFNSHTAADLQQVLEQLQREGVRGLVLDLRYNPGGLLTAAIDVCDLFLTEGVIVSTRGRDQKEEVYRAKPEGTLLLPPEKYPLAVLINRASASASEIVAAAVQDHQRAVVVGERSYGKGSVQNLIEMENRTSALKLTTQSYWRPNGHNIHRFVDSKDTDEWGVKPTEGLEVDLRLSERQEYFAYRRQRDIVHGKPGTAPAKPKADKPDKPFVDRALEKALKYLRDEIRKQDQG